LRSLGARNVFPVHWAGVSVPARVSDEVRLALLPNVPFPRLFGGSLFSSLLAVRILGGGISSFQGRPFGSSVLALRVSTLSGRLPLFSVYRLAGVPFLMRFKSHQIPSFEGADL
jgi:hypothetical protein